MKLHGIKYEEVNGSALEEKEHRNQLFDIASWFYGISSI